MLFKWTLLLVLAYFIYRSLRNLIDASLRGGQPQQKFQKRSRPMAERERPPEREMAVPRERSGAQTDADIEDAKWTDL
ncbi:MAG: hypothetical protein BMS9Abin05_1753 [Rhodothermia bacterium]|nr:MAG: hypothetical protein BMS9Abin05_1753 [Rhodothermia bacterium]